MEQGKKVTLVEIAEKPTIAGSTSGVLGGEYDLLEGLKHENIDLRLCSSLTKIGDDSVVVKNLSTDKEETIPASAVLLSVGMKPLAGIGQAFRSCAPNTSVYLVGDCLEVNEIFGATKSAFNVAVNV